MICCEWLFVIWGYVVENVKIAIYLNIRSHLTSEKDMEKAELKELLKESTEKALIELGKILDKNSSLYDELIILWKRHDDLKRTIRLGIISFEESTIENNRITKSLIEVIDKIKHTSEHNVENIKREIPIEDAIEWLKNALLGIGYTFKEEEKDDNKKVCSIFSSKIEEVTINGEGNFYIKDYSTHILIIYPNSGFVTSMSSDFSSYLTTITKGNFRDISSLFIEKNNEYGCYTIRCVATNYEKKFLIKTDKEVRNENEFYLHTEDINRAKKIKNAIDYLAIHFGRKEDPF